MTKEELVNKYGCIECEATNRALEKFNAVEESFRLALKKRREEILSTIERDRMKENYKIGLR